MWNLLASPSYFLVVHERNSWSVEAQLDRENPVYEEHVQRVMIDRPGMISADREIYDFSLDGLEVCVPATDMGFVLDQLATRCKYYGRIALFGCFHCLLLDEEQASALESQARVKLPEALAIASLENKAINEAIEELKEKKILIGGTRPVPIKPGNS